jgi:hypothetical protein
MRSLNLEFAGVKGILFSLPFSVSSGVFQSEEEGRIKPEGSLKR